MVFTLAAAVKTTLHLPAFLMTAAWTNKSFWPSYLIEVFSAHFFTNKALFKFNHRPMVILHNSHILHVGGRSVKRIALKLYSLCHADLQRAVIKNRLLDSHV